MASFVYNTAAKLIADGTIKASDSFKVMLVKASYTPANHNDAALSTNLTAAEIVATNYTGGFSGAGRKTASPTASVDNALPGAKWVFGDITWPSLGGGTNDVIGSAVLYKPGTSDTDSVPVFFWDLSDTTTNGSDFKIVMDATGGNGQFTT